MRTGRARRIAMWVALVGVVCIAIPVIARATGFEEGFLAVIVSLMPWVALASLVPLALALAARAWIVALLAAVLAAVSISWQVPLFTGGGEGEPELVVATINLRFGEADPEAIVALVKERKIDVLALSELTPDAEAGLREAGLGKELRHYVSRAEEGFSGTGLWARYPVSDVSALAGFMSQNFSATVDLPEGPITVFAVHPRAPRTAKHHVWDRELRELRTALASAEGPVIVAGDFNTTRDHEGFRDIEALGYVNAADQAGSGFAPTFSVGRGIFPFVVIDHVLERDTGLHAIETRTFVIDGADHKALVVTYARD